MKHKRSLMSIAMATLVVVSLCAVCASVSASAAPSSSANAQTSEVLVGAPIVGAPAVCHMDEPGYHANHSLELFVQGADHALWWKNLSSTAKSWSAWKPLGGYLTSDPAATSRAVNTIEVFVRGGDGALWSRNTTDGGTSWNAWYKIGGQLLTGTGPAACRHVFPLGGGYLSEGISVLVTGTNHALYHKIYDPAKGGWQAWTSLGGYLTSSPAAAMADRDSADLPILHAYVRGDDDALWEYGGSWSKIGGQLLAGTGPAAWGGWSTAGYGYSVDVFVTGTNHALYHKAYVPGPDPSKSWSAWENLGGYLTSSPAATFRYASNPPQGDVFVRGGNGALWQKTWTYSSGWTGWTGPISGP